MYILISAIVAAVETQMRHELRRAPGATVRPTRSSRPAKRRRKK